MVTATWCMGLEYTLLNVIDGFGTIMSTTVQLGYVVQRDLLTAPRTTTGWLKATFYAWP